MDAHAARALTSQLADDLSWLEAHGGKLPEPAEAADAANQLRLAAALVRNCIGPLLDEQPTLPLHIVVVGGAGAGKSTIANLLSGAPAAESNPQAGFTRHPIAYTSAEGPLDWAGHLGFLGPLQRLEQPTPSSLDEDVYQVRRVPAEPGRFHLLKDFVVWDCPDMTTWAATTASATGGPTRPGYVSRLLETAALADVIVYVASDERYNDEVPTHFLAQLLRTGKPVIVCLTKMREENASALVAHFQGEVVSHLPAGVVATLAIPFLPAEQLADPARAASRYRVPLLNQVSALASPGPRDARRRTVDGAIRFLTDNQERFLRAAQHDVAALAGWRDLVHLGRYEFDERYRREYLSGERFRGFDEALVRLMELLELPGVGKVVSGTLYVLRTPYRLLKGLVSKALSRPELAGRPEQPVLDEAMTGWIDYLRKETARRADGHPLWTHIAEGFANGGLAEQTRERYRTQLRDYQVALVAEVDRTANAIYEQISNSPGRLAALRTGKFALDAAAIASAVVTGGLHIVQDIVLVPLAAGLTQQLVEFFGKQYVDAQREAARQRQGDLLTERLSGPLEEYLRQWPATGGSSFERLQQVLQRVPQAIGQLDAARTAALARLAGPATPVTVAPPAVAVPVTAEGHRS